MANTPASTRLPAVLVSGDPACGKSHLGKALAGALAAAYLDQDTLTNPLVEVVQELLHASTFDDPRLAAAVRAPRYETLWAGAEENLALGQPVVLVAPFTAERGDPATWQVAANRLTLAGGQPVLVWVYADTAICWRRMQDRGLRRDVEKIQAAARQEQVAINASQRKSTAPSAPHIAVDGTAPTAESVSKILGQLRGYLSN